MRLVINMRVEFRPRRDPASKLPQPALAADIRLALVPIPLKALHRGAQSRAGSDPRGRKVYAHCAGGVHRGVTMGAAILIAQGMSPLSAMELIKEKRPQADPFAFYIRPRILKFANQWNMK